MVNKIDPKREYEFQVWFSRRDYQSNRVSGIELLKIVKDMKLGKKIIEVQSGMETNFFDLRGSQYVRIYPHER